MTALPPADLAGYLAAVRELLEELNRESASGLITHRAAMLISGVDQLTRTLERRAERNREKGERSDG